MKPLLLGITFAVAGFAQLVDTAPRRAVSLAYANLGSPGDGTGPVYCTDCQSTNPCLAGGGGATARREATVWNCGGGTGAGGNTSTIASGTAALGTATVAAGTCASVVTVAASGVLTTDTLGADFNADVSAVTGYAFTGNLLTIYKYPTTNNVNFKVCNRNATDVTPGAATLNWAVFRNVGGSGALTISSGTVTLGTAPITAGTCASTVTASAAGIVTTDTISADFNADPSSTAGYAVSGDLVMVYKFPTANNVNFKVCNPNASDLTPGAVTLNWKVFR